MSEIYTVNSRKFDGTIRRSWKCRLVAEEGHRLDLVGEFEQRVDHPDLGTIEAGTVSHERFFPDRWYNYFVFEYPGGILRNYYINICMPAVVSLGFVDYVDLDIDLILWPDRRLVVLDVDEFKSNSKLFEYPEAVKKKALETLDQLLDEPLKYLS